MLMTFLDAINKKIVTKNIKMKKKKTLADR